MLLTETRFGLLTALVKLFGHFYTHSPLKPVFPSLQINYTSNYDVPTLEIRTSLEHFLYDGYQYSFTSMICI